MSKLKVKFNHKVDNSMDCLGVDLEEFTEKVDNIYERLMPIKEHPEDWDVKKSSEVAEIMLKELPDEYIAIMFMRAVHVDIQRRIKSSAFKHSGLGKLDELLEQLKGSLKGVSDEDEPEKKSSKKSKDEDIEDILKEIKDGLGD